MAAEQKLCVGCTIGPIFSTMDKARNPVEIWMSSYMFSHFAELLVDYFRNDSRVRMITPTAEGCKIAASCKGVGLYSDHIFFEIIEDDEDAAKELIHRAKEFSIDEIAMEMANSINGNRHDCKEIIDYLRQELFVLSAIQSVPYDHPIPVSQLTEQLDLLECYPPFVARSDGERLDYLEKYLISLRKEKPDGWLHQHGIAKSAFAQLLNKKADEADVSDEGEAAGKNISDRLEDYVVMVQADGDNVGRFLGCLSNNGKIDDLMAFSDFLFNQGKHNAELVRSFGAIPIYFGGDDMLFISPVQGTLNGKKAFVFELIQQLETDFETACDELFTQRLSAVADASPTDSFREYISQFDEDSAVGKPALSFGVFMCHHRYPLKLIRKTAADALFGTAKRTEWTAHRSKKAVYTIMQKHSGQKSSICFEASCGETQSTFAHFLLLLKSDITTFSLHALHWKIHEQSAVVSYLLTMPDKEARAGRLKMWMKNNFDESPISDDDIEIIMHFLCAIADDLWDGTNKPLDFAEAQKQIMRSVDGAFRMHEMFVRDKDDNEKPKEGMEE